LEGDGDDLWLIYNKNDKLDLSIIRLMPMDNTTNLYNVVTSGKRSEKKIKK
jgi:hypothetical protein